MSAEMFLSLQYLKKEVKDMQYRCLLTVGLLLVSLFGDARIVLPDSMLTIQKSYEYNITSPDTAQAILETMRSRELDDGWRIDFAQGDLNYSMRRFQTALSYYQRVKDERSVRDSTQVQLFLYKRMMDCYDALSLDDELIQTTIALRKRAKSTRDKAFESMTFFMSGKWHHYHGQIERGYETCLDALEMMKDADYPTKNIELRGYYAELLKMYARDGRYAEALEMSKLEETEALKPSPAVIKKARERGLRQTYALRASMLAKAGRFGEADRAYRQWLKTTCSNPFDDMDIFEYLQIRGHYEDALGTIVRYCEFVAEQGDSISYRMLEALNQEALLHLEMGDYEKASACGQQVASIAHQLHIRRTGLQMQTTYELIMEQSASHRKTLWLGLLGALVVIGLALAMVILYYVRLIRHRNRDMNRLVNILDAYRRAVINGESPTSPQVVAAIEELRTIQLPNDQHVAGEEEPDDEDRRLFVEMDTRVTRDRLFLKPGLGRDDLMRLIGVDKNRFGKMMSKYASNTSVYINIKRGEYAAKLLLEHPEYTIATVASECGMSNTVTFNRTFKELYNMTPSEYREKMTAI
jgi:AraC-like DNA-binding protein/tetratricopeptide (TPR) repeat protein